MTRGGEGDWTPSQEATTLFFGQEQENQAKDPITSLLGELNMKITNLQKHVFKVDTSMETLKMYIANIKSTNAQNAEGSDIFS